MHNSILLMEDLQPSEILEIITDDKSVWYKNQEYGTEGMNSFVVLKTGEVYACDYSEPCSFDKIYKVAKGLSF